MATIKNGLVLQILFIIQTKSADTFWTYQDHIDPNTQDVTISCKDIQTDFRTGEILFDKEFEKGDILARGGFNSTKEDPFAEMFLHPPNNHSDLSFEFYRASRTLRGTQHIADNYLKYYTNVQRPENVDFEDFLSEASKCINKWDRCFIEPPLCTGAERYRTYDGTCNNILDPLRGAALTPYGRLLPAWYDDNVLEIRRSVNGEKLKSPRAVVNEIFAKPNPTTVKDGFIPNMGFFIMTQMLTHDIVRPRNIQHSSSTQPIRCCSSDFKTALPKSQSHFSCLPIIIPKDDPFFGPLKLGCQNFIRTQPIFPNDCKLAAAQQMNSVTSYIDLSNIYGVSAAENAEVRTFSSGQFDLSPYNILPTESDCTSKFCFFTVDFRSNQTPTLAAAHSIFMILHNKIASTLKRVNPTWVDERLFQEARRINIALMQKIVYEDIVPILLDCKIDSIGDLEDYSEHVDASTLNDFSNGFFRNLHIFSPDTINLYNEAGQLTKSVKLSDIIEDKELLGSRFNDIIRGMIYQKMRLPGYGPEIRNRVFSDSGLIAIDLQRGRDHGLSPYWRYVQLCGLGTIKTFNDLYPLISRERIELLKASYKSPLDIDILVGGGLESKNGKLLGPTFECLAKVQFSRWKFGDKLFYSHTKNPYPFTQPQLDEIDKFSFAKLLCTVTGVKSVPKNAFFVPSKQNPLVSCKDLKKLDLLPWLE